MEQFKEKVGELRVRNEMTSLRKGHFVTHSLLGQQDSAQYSLRIVSTQIRESRDGVIQTPEFRREFSVFCGGRDHS